MNGKRAKAIRHDAALLRITINDVIASPVAWGNRPLTNKQKIKFLKKANKNHRLITKVEAK